MVKPDLGKQPVETMTSLGGGRGVTLVFVNDLNAVGSPAQLRCKIDEGVLACGRFFVVKDLLRAGLSYINDRQTVQMMRLKFRGRPTRSGIHRRAFLRLTR